MVSLNKRTVKGAPLTHSELDANFQALADAIAAIPAGEQGPAGADGAPGANGADGADGASAYEVAVANGFVGTEAAWLASLVGPQGPAGADGATGATGPKGDTGDTGPAGATGATGPAGADGADGGVGQYVATIGDDTNYTFTITHNLGTKNVSLNFITNNPIRGSDWLPPKRTNDMAFETYQTSNYSIYIEEDYLSRTDNQIFLYASIVDITPGSSFEDPLPTNAITITIIGGGVGSAEYEALKTEVETARGDRSNLNNRITTISNFASPNAGGVVVGNYYDNAFQGTASTTLAGAVNRVVMAPFYTSQRLRIDQLGIAISTAVTSSSLKCFIYSSDADGWPDALLYEGGTDLSGATTGYKSHSLDFTFDNGRQYWLGVKMNSTATYRAINVSSAVNLGLSGNNATSYFTVVTRTLTYANALPDPWVFTSTDLAASSPPSIRMRAAALP